MSENKTSACSCGHDHSHEHKTASKNQSCSCGHEHTHGHMAAPQEPSCSCVRKHEDHDLGSPRAHDCACGHNHSHEHKHGAGCDCGIDHSRGTGARAITLLAISFASLVLSFFNPGELLGIELLHYLNPAWIAIIICSIPIFKGAYNGIAADKKINSSLLVSIAITASVILEFLALSGVDLGGGHDESYLFAAGEIAFLMALGELLEQYTVKKSRSGIERLLSLSPQTAILIDGDKRSEIAIDALKIGDLVLIQPNSMVSVDGTITSGSTSIDQSAMTGESIPVDKQLGDAVFAGTRNQSGAITVSVTKLSSEMAVNKLVALVEEAEGKKAPISRIADRWASKIVPAAIILSVLVAVFAYLALDISLPMAIVRGVTILVVFCPCALTLATPTAVAAGLGNAAKRGILIKSGEALEAAAKIDTFAFDKTGTLTEGKIEVCGFRAFGMDEARVLSLAGAAESHSEHPIAKAIVAYAAAHGEIAKAEQTDSIMGAGVVSKADGSTVLICKVSYAAVRYTAPPELIAAASEYEQSGASVSLVVIDEQPCGVIALADTLRSATPDALANLHSMGISTVMLTGDNEGTARSISKKIGLKSFFHSLLPHEKLDKIEQLKSEGKQVCMVGDGVNDAPALAAAQCSVAMGALGSDVAIETASVALMSSDIRRLPGFIALSRRVMGTVKANIIISLVISVAAVLLSTYGKLTPVTGALVHNAASVLVVLNSTLLLTAKDSFMKS